MSKKISQSGGSLGPVSARFVAAIQRKGQQFFTLQEAATLYGKSQHETSKFLADLVKRNVLFRCRSGLYLLLQPGKESAQLSNWPIIARELAGGRDYYLSHYSAMRLHGAASHPLFDVYITTPTQVSKRAVGDITYHFITCKSGNYWGGYPMWVSKEEQVNVSDIERTLLDGFARPDLCGGIKDVIRALWDCRHKIDWQKLIADAKRYPVKSAVKRLGYILELLELSEDVVVELMEFISTVKGYNLLDPNLPQEGRRMTKWGLQINLDADEIKASIWS